MKKSLAIFIMLFLLLPAISFAATGSCTVTETKITTQDVVPGEGKNSKKTILLTCTGGTGAQAGTVANVTLSANAVRGWYLYAVETNPGATEPADNWDLVINDSGGIDIANGLLMNRDQTNTELVNIGTGSYGYPLVTGDLTLVHSNITTESATWTVTLTFISE